MSHIYLTMPLLLIGLVFLIKGRQRIGKTTWAVAFCLYMVQHGGYSADDIISNIHLYEDDGTELKGYHYITNQQMKSFFEVMISKGIRHKILIVDEIDRVFSHRSWHNADQIDALTGLWQDEKLFNIIIGTAHIGLSVDSLIREIAQVEIIVQDKDFVNNKLTGVVMNALNKEVFMQTMNQLKEVQKLFNSWEAVK